MNKKALTSSKFTTAQAVTVGVLALAALPAQAVDYSFSDLGTMTGPNSGAGANGINNAGQVGGYNGGGAVRWDGETLTQLDNGAGTEWGVGIGISSSGQVAGYNVFPAAVDGGDAVRWDGNTPVSLNTLGFGYYSIGLGINDHDQMVGTAWAGSSFHPVRWDGTAITDIGTLGGASGEAWGINNAGQMVGHSNTPGDDADHATLWNGGTITDLGTLGGTNSDAQIINDHGQIAGNSFLDGDAASHGVLWDGLSATPLDLGTLGGANSTTQSINNLGQIVGGSELADGSSHAVLWDGASHSIIDLNLFLPPDLAAAGWVLSLGRDINDTGTIVGWAANTLDPNLGGSFKLTPSAAVPVPAAAWLLLSGLAPLFYSGRRKA